MSNYSSRSYGRRKNQTKKFIYVCLFVAAFFAVKKYAYISNPASVLADGAEEIALPIPQIELEQPPAQAQRVAETSQTTPSEPQFYKIAQSVPQSGPQSNAAIEQAVGLIDDKSGRIIEARDRLNAALSQPLSEAQQAFVKEELSRLSDNWLFSRDVFEGDKLCGYYKVKPGDMLAILAKKFKVPYEILMEINNIKDPKELRAGETIKIINGPFHCRIYRAAFTMDVFLQETYVMSFPVGLGRDGMETPTGRWIVKTGGKLVSPLWTDPETGKTYQANDPDYPLGARWIALEGIEGAAKGRDGFAIHGSPGRQASSGAVSRGCIRLYSGNEILLYNLLTPGLSQVIVTE